MIAIPSSLSDVEMQIIIIVLQLIPETLFEASFTPIYPFIVKRFLPNHLAEVGYYSGLLTTAYYIPLLIFNPIWGYISDKYGRKPVILASLAVAAITNVIVAFAHSYWTVMLARILCGSFGANSSVVKGAIGDLTQDQRVRSWAYAMYGSVFGICGMIGPLIGGVLAFPAKTYPSIFAANGFMHRYPVFVISIIYAVMNVVAFFLARIYIRDKTAEIKYENVDVGREEGDAEEELAAASEGKPKAVAYTRVDFVVFSWATMGPIVLYSLIAFTCMTYYTLLPLFLAASIEQGGLGLDSQKTSFLLSICFASNLFVCITNIVDKILIFCKGSRQAYSWSMLTYMPIQFLFPLLTATSGWTYLFLQFLAVTLLGICEAEGFQAVILMITESQQPQNLGKAHGIATSVAAISRAMSPALVGKLWDWSVVLEWNWFAFAFTAITALVGAIAAS